MKYFKKGSKVFITDLKQNEVFSLLKINIPGEFVFALSNVVDAEKTIKIGKRYHTKIQMIETNQPDLKNSYYNLIEKLGQYQQHHTMIFVCSVNDFRDQEDLIKLIPNIREDVYTNAVSLEVFNIGVKINYLPHKSGDSNYMIYYNNQTLLAFTDKGPIMETENSKLNSVRDLLT